jgi:c-di-GMP-binding flagellar brake protein YcgR
VPLLSSREIAVGQEMLFRLSANPRANVYAACLVDWDDAGLVLEVSSAPGSEPAFRDQGQRAIDVYFLRRNDGGYRFHSKVLTEVRPAPGASCEHTFLQIAHPKKLLREQRRHYLRVPLHEEVLFSRPVPRSAADPRGKESFEAPPLDQTGTISDFSGGGFRLCADGIPIRVDDIILVRLAFLDPPYDKETLVARSMKIYRECTEFGFAFEDLPAATAAAIVRFVETTHRRMAVSFARPALTR